MTIDINNLTSTTSGSAKPGRNTVTDGTKGDSPTNNTDSNQPAAATDGAVSLSDQAQTLSKLESQIKQLPDVDAEKVERIKQAITNGEFEINADRVASKISQLESGLDI